MLCAECFRAAHRLSAPHCAQCGIPFAVPMPEGSLCIACIEVPPDYDQARAVYAYDGVISALIARLKYQDRMQGLALYAQQLQCVMPQPQYDAIVPVPLHWRRLLKRRYNQAAWLAYALAGRTQLPCEPAWLMRVRHTEPQSKRTRRERLKAMRAVFAVPPAQQAVVKGANILLVDDVMTTGATASACARALKDAGAARVDVVTLARTLKDRL